MSQVTHSPFLQALGYAIVNSLWQFALLWLIYVFVNTVSKLSSHQKYSAGLLLQVSGFIWFAVTFTFYFRQYLKLANLFFPLQKAYPFYMAESNAATVREKFVALIIQSEKLLPYLSVAYLLLLVFLGFKWMRAYNLTQSIKTKGLLKTEVYWRLFVKQLSGQLGINREVKIYLSEIVQTPLTIGFFKPLILIPLASLNHLNTDQMEAVILHELAHIKRFDYLFNLFLALIETALFFNPFTVLLSRHIKRERENCCDDWVLQYNYNAASYAGALLQIATCQSTYSLFAVKATDNKQVLLNRIKRMIEKKEKSFFNYRYQLIALFVMLTVADSLALLSSHNINKASVSNSPLAEIVNSPLYDPDFFIAPDKENGINYNKLPTEKITNKNFSFDTSLARRITPVTGNETSKQKNYRKPLSAEENPAEPKTPEEPPVPETPGDPIENLITNIEISNTGSDKVVIPVADGKEREVALAEEQLKELAIHLLKENKAAFNQKKIVEEIKAAVEQLQAVKIQLELANHEIRYQDSKEIFTIPKLSAAASTRLKITTKKMQRAMKEAKEKWDRSSKADFDHFYNFILPPAIYPAPFKEKPHSFSYEFPEKPKVKVVASNSFNSLKKVIRIVITEDANDCIPKRSLHALQEVSRPKVSSNRNFYVIKI